VNRGLKIGLAALAALTVSLVVLSGASAHRSGCHAAHSCPSDHHTYIWYDSNGQGWDCAEPGAPKVGPNDTTVIVYDGRTYYCHAAGGSPPPPPPPAPPPPPPPAPPPPTPPPPPAPPPTPPPAPTHTVLLAKRTKTTACHVRGPLQDRRCSPGAIYADAPLELICTPNYTKKVRSVSQRTKDSVFREYGLPVQKYGRTYEIDHIVSLELGGSNDMPTSTPRRPSIHRLATTSKTRWRTNCTSSCARRR
jgi:hypothetical protein